MTVMADLFCPKCDMMLAPKKKDGNKYLVCRACGFEKLNDGSSADALKLTEKIDHTHDKTLIRDEQYWDDRVGEGSGRECPRCKSKMIMKSQQTRSADEGITHFFICIKCNKQIRLYS